MKRVLTLVLAAVMLFSCVAVFSACGSDEEDTGAVVNAYYVGEIYDFDPARALVDDSAVKIMSLIYEPLFKISEKGKLQKALADSYTYLKEENAIEITLKDSYWSDGRSVSANDFLYAWERILDPEYKSAAAPLLYDIKNAVAVKNGDTSKYNLGVTADRKLLTIELEEGVDIDAFLRNLASVALSPIRDDAVTKLGRNDYWSKRTFTILTNGPFKLSGLKYNDGTEGEATFRLERNQYFRRDLESETSVKKYVTPYRIETNWMYTLEDAYAAYIEGTIFYIGDIPLANRAENKKDANVSDLLSTYTYVFNHNHPLFADENVRLALSAAIDREYIVEMITFGKAATGFVSHGVFDVGSAKSEFADKNENKISTTADMDTARAYLAKADIAPGMSMSFTLSYRKCEESQAIAEYVKSQWEQLGFNVKLEPLGYKSFTVIEYDSPVSLKNDALQIAYETGEYDVIGIDYQMNSTSAFGVLANFSSVLSGNGTDMDAGATTGVYETRTHVCGFASKEYDSIIEAAQAQKDLKAKSELLHQAESYMIDHMVVMPLVFNQDFFLAKKDLSKIKVSYFGYPILTKMKLKNYEDYLEEETSEE